MKIRHLTHIASEEQRRGGITALDKNRQSTKHSVRMHRKYKDSKAVIINNISMIQKTEAILRHTLHWRNQNSLQKQEKNLPLSMR